MQSLQPLMIFPAANESANRLSLSYGYKNGKQRAGMVWKNTLNLKTQRHGLQNVLLQRKITLLSRAGEHTPAVSL